MGQLQGRDRDGALSDSDRDGFPRHPLPLEGLLNPFRRRDQARVLAGQVDSRARAQPQRLGVIGKFVDPEQIADRIEIDVARNDDGAVEVHGAVAPALFPDPVVVSMSVEGDQPGAVDRVVWLHRVRLERGRSGDDLEDRPGGEVGLNGLVHQRLQGVRSQLLPLLPIDVAGEFVGVVSGMAHHGQHFSRLRRESHHGAGTLAQRSFRRHLQVDVDGDRGGKARRGRLLLRLRDLHPPAVDDHASRAIPSHEQRVVLALDAELSHHVASLVIRVRSGNHLLRHLAHIAQYRRQDLVLRVDPLLDLNHVEFGVFHAVRFHKGHVLERRRLLEHHRLEARQVRRAVHEYLDFHRIKL